MKLFHTIYMYENIPSPFRSLKIKLSTKRSKDWMSDYLIWLRLPSTTPSSDLFYTTFIYFDTSFLLKDLVTPICQPYLSKPTDRFRLGIHELNFFCSLKGSYKVVIFIYIFLILYALKCAELNRSTNMGWEYHSFFTYCAM